MRVRPRLVLWAIASTGVACAVAAAVACAPRSTPPAFAGLGDPTPTAETIGSAEGLGCGDRNVVCVNACTGRLVNPDKEPLVAEGQSVVVRTVGWASCRPQQFECKANTVANIDVGYRGAPASPGDGGSDSSLAFLDSVLQPIPEAPLPLTAQQRIDAVASQLEGVPDGGKSEAAHGLARAFRAATSAADAAQLSKPKHFRAEPLLAAAALSRLALAPQIKVGKEALTPAVMPSCQEELQEVQRRANEYNRQLAQLVTRLPELGSVGAPLSASIANAQDAVSRYWQAAEAACSTEASTGADTGAHLMGMRAGVGDGGAPMDPVEKAREQAAAANQALAAVQSQAAATKRAAEQARASAAQRDELTSFGDCVVTVPTGLNNRQIVVDVKTTPFDCSAQPSNPRCSPAAPVGDADSGSQANANAGDAGLPRATRDALVTINVDHGKYYWDVGLLLAVVPEGQRTVGTSPAPGIPGTSLITVDQRASTLTAIALNVYPLGHRRQAYGFFEGPWRNCWTPVGDMLGLQLALNTDLKNATQTLFGGVVVEPVTGLSLDLGAVFLQGDFLKAGFAPGMAAPTDRTTYVATSTMARLYFGVTFGYELFHTTASQLAAFQGDMK